MNMVFSEKVHEYCVKIGKSNIIECVAELLEVAVSNLSILELLRGRQVITVEKASVNCRVRQSSGRLRHEVIITLPSELYNRLKDRHYVTVIIVL